MISRDAGDRVALSTLFRHPSTDVRKRAIAPRCRSILHSSQVKSSLGRLVQLETVAVTVPTCSIRSRSILLAQAMGLSTVIHRLITSHVQRRSIETLYLWSAELSFADGLHRALRMRNQMVHGGEIRDPRHAWGDSRRLMVLTELILLEGRADGATRMGMRPAPRGTA